jgi:3-oxoacyl-[acyl-carrier protein] reductase
MPRNIIVTGGATGIGRSIAVAFVDLGESVFITGRRQQLLEETAHEIGASAVSFDASDPGQVTLALDVLPREVDVLVNTAGGNTNIGAVPPRDLQGVADAWIRNFRNNVMSAVLVTTAVDSRLRSGGAIISFSSIGAEKASGSYAAAKAAIGAWNLTLSAELGPRDITANVIAPGYIENTEFFRATMTEARRQSLQDAATLGRVGVPTDIAGTVLFLASPAARFITGQTIHVNGGAWATR